MSLIICCHLSHPRSFSLQLMAMEIMETIVANLQPAPLPVHVMEGVQEAPKIVCEECKEERVPDHALNPSSLFGRTFCMSCTRDVQMKLNERGMIDGLPPASPTSCPTPCARLPRRASSLSTAPRLSARFLPNPPTNPTGLSWTSSEARVRSMLRGKGPQGKRCQQRTKRRER
jgi:hypothetical protein